jgi:hypothetical protein
MDPITILGAVAAAAQLAGTTANIGLQLYRVFCEAKSAPKKSKELCDEISELCSVMNDLVDALKAVEGNFDIAVASIISPDSLRMYSKFLKDLSSRIQVNKNEN